MQREIAQLLAAWQQDRADEERVLADVMSAIADLAAARQAFLDALDTAARSMTRTSRPTPSQAYDMTTSISDVIKRMRQDSQHGYN